MSFQQGLSGLDGASKVLEAIGNNVANSSTVGFKQSQVQFSDIYASTLLGSGASQIGIGTQVARVSQLFSQGNVTASANPLDMAINGNGFFRMNDGGAISYTRNGQFQPTKEGYIVNAAGARLTGYLADANGVIQTGTPTDIMISKADMAPRATATYQLGVKLDSREDAKVAAAFDPDDPTTYTHATSAPVYDSLGNSHDLKTFYVKTGPNAWSVFATNDGVAVPTGSTPQGQIATMTFSGNGGALATTNPTPIVIPMAVTTGATTPFNITLDPTETQQMAGEFGLSKQLPDGYRPGKLIDFSVTDNGMILGRYNNGENTVLGQVILSNFANPNGLQNVGDNQWVETAESGVPMTSTPGSSGLGSVQSSRIEESNVDLTAELVNMITAQRFYQANAQTIKTQDQIMQTLVNLR
jgi:flagellar hook protein FlgE